MSIQTRMDKEFNTISEFAAELSVGVQEELSPTKQQVAQLQQAVEELIARVTKLETQAASASTNQ